MTSRNLRGRGVVALLMTFMAVPAWAESPLAVVPASSPIVIQVHGLDRTKDRLIATLTSALPDLGQMANFALNAGLQNLPEGRKLTGLAKDGPIFVSLAHFPTGEGIEGAGIAIAARVTDYDAFRNGLLSKEEKDSVKKEGEFEKFTTHDRTHYLFKVGDFAVITPDKDVATAYAKKGTGLDSKMDQQLAVKFLNADAAAYVNMQAVAKEYGDQIKAFREQMEQLFDSGALGPGMDKNTMEMVKKLIAALGQFMEDAQGVVVAVESRPESFHLGLFASVAGDSKTNAQLRNFKTAAMEELGTLPSGMMSYSATAVTGEILKSFPVIFGFASGGEDEGKAALAALEKLVAAGPQFQLQASTVPAGGIQVWSFKDAAKGAAAQLELFKAMASGATLNNAQLKGKPEVKADAQSHRGFKFHSAKIQFDLEKMVENVPVPQMQESLKAYFKKLVGEEINIWFGTDGKKNVTLTAKDWDAARKLLDTYLDGKATLANDKEFQASREQFPRQTTLLTVTDAAQFFPFMADAVLTMLKDFPGAPQLPDIKVPPPGKPAYLGFSLNLESERVGAEMDISTSAIKEIRRVAEPIVKAFRDQFGG